MSSSSGTPEWASILAKELEENPKQTSYALSTLSPEGLPKCRFVIHRMITPSNLLLTTTDTRMQKPVHLSHSPSLEVAWWMEPSAVQFRIAGKGYTVPPFASAQDMQPLIDQLDLPPSAPEAKPEWWEEERKRLWKEVMSSHLRASFGRPKPGMKRSDAPPEDSWPVTLPAEFEDVGKDKEGNDEGKGEEDREKDKKDIEFALSNFAILAIEPEGVEYLELKAKPNRRTQWNKRGGEWEKVEVCP